MEHTPIMKQEYETQYFGFYPLAFTDIVYTTIFEYSLQAFNALEALFCKSYGHVMSVENIQSSTDAVFDVVEQRTHEACKELEIFLSNEVLVIPKHIILPGDKIHDTNPVTKEECEQLDVNIANLKQKILEAKMLRAYLKQKLRDQKIVKEALNVQGSRFKKLKTKLNSIEESLFFAVTKASELGDCLQCTITEL